jgi:hypothetical protein
MFAGKAPRRGSVRGWIAIAGAVCAAARAGDASATDPPANRKMHRQIEVMEQIIDQVLIDSPNFLVRGRDNARGMFVKELGLIFTFEASLIEKDHDFWKSFTKSEGFEIKEDDGGRIIIIPKADHGDTVDAEEVQRRADTLKDRQDSRQERLYLRGKTEIVDVLLDYGDTLTTLEDNQWIAIVAYLTDSEYFAQNRFSRLILKAKVKDLREYAAEKLSEEEMIKRIVEEEY